ncbi:MAG: prepilin peptidase [Peptostreptococcaceae bacterium]|nr:prepilin peptidase [Peptostreptococcaceae bacterium]
MKILLLIITLFIAIIDFKHKTIDKQIIKFGFIICLFFKFFILKEYALYSNILSDLFILIIFLPIYMYSKNIIGGGDIKLFIFLGFFLELKTTIILIFLSFNIGGIISLILIMFKIKNKKDNIAFAPMIFISLLILNIYII